MTSLVESRDESKWRRALESYEDKIAVHSASGKRRSKLVDLDQAVRVAIPEAVNARRNDANPVGYLTKADICQIVEWKITRGKFRPLMRFANALTAEQAKGTSKEALELAGKDIQGAMSELVSLKGIGPATASAILSWADPSSQCPFLSDEAMHAFDIVNSNGKLDYTMANWKRLESLCSTKAEELNGSLPKDSEFRWSAATVERAVWASTVQ